MKVSNKKNFCFLTTFLSMQIYSFSFSPRLYILKRELRHNRIDRSKQTIAADQHTELPKPNLRYVQLISLLISCLEVSLSSSSSFEGCAVLFV